jgi:hypothetical protein
LESRFISAVALYGPKTGRFRDFLLRVQDLIAEQAGDRFLPYSLDQVHATLIALDGIPDPRAGTIVNEHFLTQAGVRRPMDLGLVMDTLASHFARPLRVRLGGYRPDQEAPFTSRGQHPYERAFSVQGDGAFVVIGWPPGPGRPLDRLRRDMNAAGVLHRHHRAAAGVDNDFHLVVGHHAGAPAAALGRATDAVRALMAAEPVDLDVGLEQVKVVAAGSRTLAPPQYVSGIPADEEILRALMS